MADNAAARAYELGREYEHKYGGCSQCVLAALQDTFGIRQDDVFKAASGLAGGGATTTEGSCGAYSGAIMFLSLLQGRERNDFADPNHAMGKSFVTARKLRDRFIQEYGSVVCRNIQTKLFGRPFYLADPAEFEKFEKAGGHDVHCPQVVGNAARWAAEIVIESGLAPAKQ